MKLSSESMSYISMLLQIDLRQMQLDLPCLKDIVDIKYANKCIKKNMEAQKQLKDLYNKNQV